MLGLVAWLCPLVALAEVDVQLTRRTADGVALQWAAPNPGITGFEVHVVDATDGRVVLPPTKTEDTKLTLPLPKQGRPRLRPDRTYEVTVQPLPDGVAGTLTIPPFVLVEAEVEAVPNDAVLTLMAENEMEVNKQYAANDKLAAQALLMLSTNGWFRSLGEHRVEMAIATDLELDNWKKSVTQYFDRREENMRGQMRVAQRYEEMKDQRLRQRQNAIRRQLSVMLLDPKYAGQPDTAMNFLLDRLSHTAIGYGIGLQEYFATHPSHDRWDLSPQMLESIRVMSPATDGGQTEFSLAEPLALKFDYWPPLLQELPFRGDIVQLLQARDQLLAYGQQNPQLPREAIIDLEIAFAGLTQHFYSVYPPPWQGMMSGQVLDLIRVEDHLAQLNREIKAVRDRNTLDAMSAGQYFDPAKDGRDAASLIAWMTRNGMSFAPARPGTENHYAALLTKLKELTEIFGDPLPGPFDQLPRSDQPAAIAVPRPQ